MHYQNRLRGSFRILSTLTGLDGDRDVDDIVMLVTLWWWLISDVGGRINSQMLTFRYVADFLNVLNRSPRSWIGHQHPKVITNTFGLQHPSPTSMWPFVGVGYHDVDDLIMVTVLASWWWQNDYISEFFNVVTSTFQSCHQHQNAVTDIQKLSPL